ncbi:MAG: SCO family protein [Hyphomonadaceae bacterium]
MRHSLTAFWNYLSPSLGAVVVGVGLLWISTDGGTALTDESARRVRIEQQTPLLPAFVLEDMRGDTVVIGADGGHTQSPTVVEFIYTSCPTICQSAGAPYARLRDRLDTDGLGGNVRLLSVSFDPNSDDAPALQNYARLHKADGDIWNVARIDSNDFAAVKSAFGLRIIADEWGGYQHNVAMLIIDPVGRLVKAFDNEDVEGVYDYLESKHYAPS